MHIVVTSSRLESFSLVPGFYGSGDSIGNYSYYSIAWHSLWPPLW